MAARRPAKKKPAPRKPAARASAAGGKAARKKAPAKKPPTRKAAATKASPKGPVRPASVEAYLAALPEDRRQALSAVRDEINRRLPAGYEEGIQYGMIGWHVPHTIFPDGYHCDPRQPLPFASIASQKGHMAVYLMCVYMDPKHRAWFEKAWAKTGKRMDMGKSCVRFKRLEDLPLELVGEAVARVPVKDFVAHYVANLPASARR